MGQSWPTNSGSVDTDSRGKLLDGKTDRHCKTTRNPNGEKVGEMDIKPKEESDTD